MGRRRAVRGRRPRAASPSHPTPTPAKNGWIAKAVPLLGGRRAEPLAVFLAQLSRCVQRRLLTGYGACNRRRTDRCPAVLPLRLRLCPPPSSLGSRPP